MTTQADKAKQKKKRALKKKHEHETEHMHEEAARKKVAHREETVVIIILLALVPFLLTGIFFWPSSTSTATGSKGGTGLANGSYSATCMNNASGSNPPEVTIGIPAEAKGMTNPVLMTGFSVNPSDLSGNALMDSGTVFQTQPGQQVDITVKNGYITDWIPTSSPG